MWTGILKHQQIPDALAAVDIALQSEVTSYSSPLKLFDYMAAGKAIVAPRRQNIIEIINDGVTGILFEPGNLKDLGCALRRLTYNPDLRQKIGHAARTQLFDGAFTWDANAERIIKLIKKD